ncbi:MAG: hypothetical protein U0Q16_20575 [Bryobacteraceae bacterium]
MKTGYEISLSDFLDLCVDDHQHFAPLLRQWFGYEIVLLDAKSPAFEIRDRDGLRVEVESVHDRIQADPQRQNTIYNCAMTHWH